MNTTGNRRDERGLPLICLAITVVILIAGLWPFNFFPRNEVTWLKGQNGIHFGRRGIAYSTESVYGPQEAIRPGKPVSIELVVRPAREPNYSIPRILTLYTEGNRQFFTLAQWESSLIIRADPQGSNLRLGSPEMSARNTLLKNIPVFLTIISNNGNTAIYVNGQMMKVTRNFPILPADFSSSAKFVLGNSPTGHSPWAGDLLFLASYDRELPSKEVWQHYKDWKAEGIPTWLPGKPPPLLYLFDESTGLTSRNYSGDRYDISIPATFHVLNKTVLRFPWEEEFDRSFIHDVVVNIFGFLPFGFFLAMWLGNGNGLTSKSHVFLISMLGGCISFIIELLQIYLPTRYSQLTDVISNISGTILGVYLYQLVFLFLRIEKRSDR